MPTSLKVRTNCELLGDVIEKFKDVFKISRVKSPFLMRVTLTAYYNYLVEGGECDKNIDREDTEDVKLGDLKAEDEWYDYILENYGKRKCRISDIATTLKIAYEDANYLTYFLGYRRGKEDSIKMKSQFISDAGVKAIYAKIR